MDDIARRGIGDPDGFVDMVEVDNAVNGAVKIDRMSGVVGGVLTDDLAVADRAVIRCGIQTDSARLQIDTIDTDIKKVGITR